MVNIVSKVAEWRKRPAGPMVAGFLLRHVGFKSGGNVLKVAEMKSKVAETAIDTGFNQP